MELTSRVHGAVSVLELSGRFDAYVAPRVAEWLDGPTSVPPARVVVQLSGVPFMDSTALGSLVRGMKAARRHQGDLHLCALQRPVRVVFELTQLDRVFHIFATEAEAVQAFGD